MFTKKRIVGLVLVLGGATLLALVSAGFVAWTAPADAGAAPRALAGSISARTMLSFLAGSACLLVGAALLVTRPSR